MLILDVDNQQLRGYRSCSFNLKVPHKEFVFMRGRTSYNSFWSSHMHIFSLILTYILLSHTHAHIHSLFTYMYCQEWQYEESIAPARRVKVSHVVTCMTNYTVVILLSDSRCQRSEPDMSAALLLVAEGWTHSCITFTATGWVVDQIPLAQVLLECSPSLFFRPCTFSLLITFRQPINIALSTT